MVNNKATVEEENPTVVCSVAAALSQDKSDAAERVSAQGLVFHAQCFRCTQCDMKLSATAWWTLPIRC